MLLSINICTAKKHTELETLIYETVSHYSKRNHKQIRQLNKHVCYFQATVKDITLRKIITAKTVNSLL